MPALATAIYEPAPTTRHLDAKDRLIVALDVPTVAEAEKIVAELDGLVSFYKIGMQLQFAGGLDFCSKLIELEKKVFLDSKLLDIENTITGAVQSVAKMGVTFLTIHGQRKAIKAAVLGKGASTLKILAVTVLTNLDESDLSDLNFNGSLEEFVQNRTIIAIEAGADGVIASGLETPAIRKMAGDKLTIVVPGIRPTGSPLNDQRRAVTPAEAIKAGADYLVVGRPILNAKSAEKAATQIVKEIEAGLNFKARYAN